MQMTRYVLLLRGVNVGTKNSLPMAELQKMLKTVGCAGVQTYIQSGNAVFGTKLDTAALTQGIEAALSRYMGRPIATTLRTLAEMRAIVEKKPFAEVAAEPKNVCVTFLSHEPTPEEVAPLYATDFKPELFLVRGREIFTCYPHGQGNSPLAKALGKLPLRGAVTTRNWSTTQRLFEMLEKGPEGA